MPHPDPGSAGVPTSKQLNAAAVLRLALERPALTASDVMAPTGLTRSTAIALADDLVAKGWLRELPNARAGSAAYRKGRPARRYALDAGAGLLVGVDAGSHDLTVRICDLRGEERGRDALPIDPEASPSERRAAVTAQVAGLLAVLDARREDVLCLVLAVPAPVDDEGRSPRGVDSFWEAMNPEYVEHVAPLARHVIVENDANAAALAEGASGAGRGLGSYVTLLSGPRFGAGCVVDGRLVRGARGAAGELGFIRQIDGIGSTEGVDFLVRDWIREERGRGVIGERSPLALGEADDIHVESVRRAAAAGDLAAQRIQSRLVERLARVCALLGGMLDVERIVFSGPFAASLEPVLASVRARTHELGGIEERGIVVSPLGDGVVSAGALTRARTWVAEAAAELVSGPAPRVGSDVEQRAGEAVEVEHSTPPGSQELSEQAV